MLNTFLPRSAIVVLALTLASAAGAQSSSFKAHWRDRTIEDAFVTFTLNPEGTIDSARMAAVSPLADFSFDYQDLLLKPHRDDLK